jgi:heterodisulfide reductase subunit A
MDAQKHRSLSAADAAQDTPRIGVFVCQCGLNIAQTVDCQRVADAAAGAAGVVLTKVIAYACSTPGQSEIAKAIEEAELNRVVVASCSPRLHEPTFRKMMQSAGLNPYVLEMANLREQCSWVHMSNPEAATLKAIDLVKMSISRASALCSLEEGTQPLTRRTMVIGGGVSGIQAALDLADSGYEVVLVEKQPSIGGLMAQLDKTFPTMDCSI